MATDDDDGAASRAASGPVLPWPAPRRAWYAVAILHVAYALAILDRISIGLLVDPIKRDLGVSDTQMGLLQGLAFALFYVLFSFPVGYLVDRWGRVRLLAGGILLWSAATIASGFSRSFPALFASRIMVGAGEATVTPVASSMIGDLFPPAQRGRAFGVLNLGGTLGTGLAYVVGGAAIGIAQVLRAAGPGWLAGYRDWHIVYFVIGLPGLLVAALLIFTIGEPARRERRHASGGGAGLRETLAHMRRNALAYLSIILGAVLSTMLINAGIAWYPTLIMRVYGWSAAEVGLWFGLIGLPCGAISALSGGWVLSWLARRGRVDGPILVVIVQSSVWILFGTFKSLAPSPELALLAHFVTSLASVWSVTAILAGLVQITPNEMRGQVTALYVVSSGFIGLTIGTAIVGLLSDHVFQGHGGIAWSLGSVYCLGGAASVLVLLAGRRAFIRAVRASGSWATAG